MSPRPSCSHSVAPTAGLPGGLRELPCGRCPCSNCSHSVAPTAGLPGGPFWLRMSTCRDPKRSHSGAAIAATSGGLQQLPQHTTSLAIGGPGLFPMPGHARSDQLAARPLAAPAGLPVQRLGGACREGTCQHNYQVLWPITLLHQGPHLSAVSKGQVMSGSGETISLPPFSFTCHSSLVKLSLSGRMRLKRPRIPDVRTRHDRLRAARKLHRQ